MSAPTGVLIQLNQTLKRLKGQKPFLVFLFSIKYITFLNWFVLYTQEVRVMFNSLASLRSVEEILFKRHETDMDCLVYSGSAPAVLAS